MRRIPMALLISLCALELQAQGAPPQGGANQPYTMEYYYKTQWGRQQEFLNLFLKNHYPLLLKEVEAGRLLSVKIETPANHMTEDARWDYRVTLTFKNSTFATTSRASSDVPAGGGAALRDPAGTLGSPSHEHYADEEIDWRHARLHCDADAAGRGMQWRQHDVDIKRRFQAGVLRREQAARTRYHRDR